MKRFSILCLLILIVILPGCWDMQEISEIGLVMATGIDRPTDGSGNFLVTVQIADPTGSNGSGDEKSKSSSDKSVWVCSGEGKTIFEAVRDLIKVSSKRIMWAHNNLILVGEKLAKDDITAVVDFFTHNHELRMKTLVAVSHGDAKNYLVAKIGTGEIPGIAISKLFKYQRLAAESYYNELLDIYSDFNMEDADSLISGIDLRKPAIPDSESNTNKEEDQVELSGAAVFDHSKMVGWLSPEETRGLSWALNKTDKTVVSAYLSENSNNSAVAVETHNVKAKIKTYVDREIPYMEITVSGKGSIVEEDTAQNLYIDNLKSTMENKVNKTITDEITRGVNKVQKDYRCDVLRIGRWIHIQHKKEWDERIKKNWVDIYPKMQVRVSVNIDIISSTLNEKAADYR